MASVESVGGYLVTVPDDKVRTRDVVDPQTGAVVGTIRKDADHGTLWHTRVAGVPWVRGRNGRVPYDGAADSKAKAVAIIHNNRSTI